MFKIEQRPSFTTIIVITVFIVIGIFDAYGYNEKEDGIIYILVWTQLSDDFYFVDMGRRAFSKCFYSNCFLTNNKYYFRSILDFKVLILNNVHFGTAKIDLPNNRSSEQIYCMYGVEPGAYHAIPIEFNEYFNITITYKLSSNLTLPYLVVKNEDDEVIGPKIDMQWKKLSDMNETSNYVKNKLQNKHIAAAWIVSNCESPWRRMYAHTLQKELERFGHSLDIYGKCGTKQCLKDNLVSCGEIRCPQHKGMDECFSYIESDYFFYLSFENSYGEDYVTEKLLHALEHFAVPVVLGGADYNRFMPEGIYLNANSLEPYQMADKMIEIMKDKDKYYDFFKWYDHYSFHFAGENGYKEKYCELCAFLNENINKTGSIEFIAEWWNEEQPPYPSPDAPIDIQNNIEKVLTNIIDFLNPSSDDLYRQVSNL